MRLRNIPRAESVLEACKEVVKDPESLRGDWNQTFKKLKINVKCKATITGSGIESSTMKKK